MTSPKRNIGSLIADLLTYFISILWLLPLVFAVLVTFRPSNETMNQGTIFFGSRLTIENYINAFNTAPWGWQFYTSVAFVVGVLVVQFFTITMAGYAFARMKFWGRNVLLYAVLLQLMIPTGVLLIQNFAVIRALGAFDTRWALMMPYWASAFGVLLLRQTFREIPFDLEEAARIDGANLLQVMWHVYVPLSVPAYVAFSLVSVSSHWNEFLWPAIVTRTPENQPLTIGLSILFNSTAESGSDYGQLMAGTLMVIAPLVVMFILFQRRFIESFASSGIK
jgi:sn-glycerol 3-phosphate transport system permease protein